MFLNSPGFFHSASQGLIEGAGKQREVWEVFGPRVSVSEETPNLFKEKAKELHVARVCHFRNPSASLLTETVHKQSYLLCEIRGTNFLEKSADHFRIIRTGCPHAHGIMVAGLNGAQNTLTLSPAFTRHRAR